MRPGWLEQGRRKVAGEVGRAGRGIRSYWEASEANAKILLLLRNSK